MRQQTWPQFLASFWKSRFPGQISDRLKTRAVSVSTLAVFSAFINFRHIVLGLNGEAAASLSKARSTREPCWGANKNVAIILPLSKNAFADEPLA